MALEDLTPAVRVEAILDGADIDPATRLEYFLSKAANEVPKPDGVSDAGKVVTVNSDGDGFILNEVDPGLPDIAGVSDAGKVVTVNSAGSAYELSEVDPGLPDIAGVSDAGKVVTVNSAGSAYELSEVDPGLPDISGVSDAGKIVTVNTAGSAYELVTPSGYIAPASSATVTNKIQSLVNDIMTNILTGSKTNIVYKSAVLTHADLASDYAILRETAKKYCSGVHTLFPVAANTYSTVVNGYYESGGTGANLQVIVPSYGIQIPGVGQKVVFLVIALASSGQAYLVSVSAQINETIT